jgi:hypothetical protein
MNASGDMLYSGLLIGKKLLNKQNLFISGGFTKPGIVKALLTVSILNSDKKVRIITPISAYKNDHCEGDTLVWLHAVKCTSNKVLVYSPDNDVHNIGLCLLHKYPHKCAI